MTNKLISRYLDNKLNSQAIVLIDDCALAYGGKGRFVIATLLQWGWRMIEQGYQVILTRK